MSTTGTSVALPFLMQLWLFASSPVLPSQERPRGQRREREHPDASHTTYPSKMRQLAASDPELTCRENMWLCGPIGTMSKAPPLGREAVSQVLSVHR
jgi:hypothetical protein